MITKSQSYFPDFPLDARLWVFMAERKLTNPEVEVVNIYMKQFMPQWNAHGNALKSDFELIENQFLVIVVDEMNTIASGCSIDSMTRFIKEIESKIDISFTNRMLIAYIEDGIAKTEKLNTFKNIVKERNISKNTIVYNNSVSNLSDFRNNWKKPLIDSWASSFLPS